MGRPDMTHRDDMKGTDAPDWYLNLPDWAQWALLIGAYLGLVVLITVVMWPVLVWVF